MRYAILPIVILLALIEFVLRVTALVILTPVTLFIGPLFLEIERPGAIERLLTPVCFDLAKQLT
jgi:hypothetical protein